MKIRAAEKEDKNQLYALMREYYFGDRAGVLEGVIGKFDEPADNVAHPEIVPNAVDNENIVTFVAEVEDKLVGYVIGQIEQVVGKKLSKEGYIAYLFVVKEYRGKKIGEKLLKKIEEAFRNSNCTHVAIEAFATNKSAIEIYQHLGFSGHYVALKKII